MKREHFEKISHWYRRSVEKLSSMLISTNPNMGLSNIVTLFVIQLVRGRVRTSILAPIRKFDGVGLVNLFFNSLVHSLISKNLLY